MLELFLNQEEGKQLEFKENTVISALKIDPH